MNASAECVTDAPFAASYDIQSLKRRWHAARSPGAGLPPYEEVVLGGLGRLADRFVIFECKTPGSYRILSAGRRIPAWTGADRSKYLADLSREFSGTVGDILSKALLRQELVLSQLRRVRDGMVEISEVLALPLADRWGRALVGVYVHEIGARYNLVDTIFQSTGGGILALVAVRDLEGKPADFQIVAANEAAARLLDVPLSALQWRHASELQPKLSGEVFGRLVDAVQSGRHDQFELALPHVGSQIHLKVGITAIGDILAVTLTDIGDIKESEASFRLLFDSNPVPMWVYGLDRLNFIAVNDAAVAHYGYSRQDFQGMTLRDIWPRDERDSHEHVARSVDGAYQSGRSWRQIKADGSEIEVLTYAQRLAFGQRQAVLVANIDVTERKQAEARIAHMAHHDALTNLPNRVLFNLRLDDALAAVRTHGVNLAVHCIDLDHFKSVNDSLGHPVGDILLKEVARRLAACMRETDMVVRLGGDEFAVIQSPVGQPSEAGKLAGRLIESISQKYDISGHEIVVGASIGIATAPDDGADVDMLMRNADMALYRAKAEGRGTFHFFEPEMDRRMQERRRLELDLRKALAASQFDLFYQPLVSIEDEEIAGFEALLRWRHPERGMVSPADFIPLCEEIGLIVPIGEWVLREACKQAALWPDHLKIAVNLSPIQFRSRGVVQAVVTALAYSGLDPRRLELEITESVLLGETDANLTTLHQLRAIGVRISMDDFGTGYSSLSYLRSFPFDKIKIDRSFVRELVERPDCLAIIRAVTGLSTSLGISTTAEGVETREQLTRLREEGCTEVQGFLFSPPRPLSELGSLLDGASRSQSAA